MPCFARDLANHGIACKATTGWHPVIRHADLHSYLLFSMYVLCIALTCEMHCQQASASPVVHQVPLAGLVRKGVLQGA